MTRAVLALLAASILSLSPDAAFSDPRMGRLPDGRAYRVDGEGYQLVDHIAELEVTVDELNRQIDQLEAQVGKSGTPVQAAACPPAPICPAVSTASDPTDCSAETASLERRVAILDSELQRAKYSNAPVVQSCNYETRLQPLREEIALLKHQLNSAPSKNVLQAVETRELQLQNALRSTQELLEKRASQIEAAQSAEQQASEALQSTRAELESTKLALEESQDRLQSLTKSGEQLASVQSELSRMKGELAQERASRAAVMAELELKRRGNIVAKNATSTQPAAQLALNSRADESIQSPARAMLSGASAPEFGAMKSEFQSRLKEIQSLVLKRKDLSDSARAKRNGVAISLQALQSSRGQSLDSIRSLIAAMQSERDARSIRLALSEIKQILLDDIQTFERLRKL